MSKEQEQQELEQKLEELRQSDRLFDILDGLMRYSMISLDYETFSRQRKEAEDRHLQLCQWFAERNLSITWNAALNRYEASHDEIMRTPVDGRAS